MAELPNLGKHCSFSQCKQLDFLPFMCDGCSNTFCSEHRVKETHDCSWENLTAATGQYDGVKAYTCSLEGCTNRELTPIVCEKCNISFCLSHRHAVDHQCSKLEDKPTRGSKTAEHVTKILESKSVEPKKPRGGRKASKTAAKVALMKMKLHAVGDKGCPETERVYVRVYPPLETNKTPQPMFFSKVWSVGRAIDSIAERLGIHNYNNQQNAKKLRLFSSDSGAIFPTEGDLDSLLQQELLFSGSSIVIEYVDNDVMSLQDLSAYNIS